MHGADLVVVCLGTGQDVESEGRNKPDLNLPGKQASILQDAEMHGMDYFVYI